MSVKRVSSFGRPLDRAVSVSADDRSIKSKSATPSLIGRWKSFRASKTAAAAATGDDRSTTPPTQVVLDGNDYYPSSGDSLLDENSDSLVDELSVKVCRESIRQSIIEQTKISGGDVKLLLDIESNRLSGSQDGDTTQNVLKGVGDAERNTVLLWCAFVKRHDLLEALYDKGVDLSYTLTAEGLGAVHLSSLSGCVKCVKWLIGKKCDVNARPDALTPLHCAVFGNSPDTVRLLMNNGAKVSDTVVHYAVRANAIECLQILSDRIADVNVVDACGVAPLHLAADRRMSLCMKLLLERPDVNPNVATRDKCMTPLHYAAEGGYLECVEMLLVKGADHSRKNKKGQTPLHLAAKSQSVECIEALLRVGAAIDEKDADSRTPLHAAVGKALLAVDSVEALLRRNADVNTRDRYGYTPLHVAALNELVQCVDVLIMHGADVSSRTKGGVSALSIVARKTPDCLSTICKKLDASISLHDPETTNREVYLKLNFRYLLQHSSGGEVGLLKTLIDEGQKGMLEHPLCGAFLYTKWLKIRRFYFCRLLLSAIFVFLLTAYVLTALAHYCYNAAALGAGSANVTDSFVDRELCTNNSVVGAVLVTSPESMRVIWYVLVIFSLCETTRKLMSVAGYSALRYYFFHPGNVFEWFTILSVFVVSFTYTDSTYTWQNHVAAFSILFGWANLMMMIGQLPVFGTYVAMFTKVSKEFFKLLTAYLCVLIGFTISFCIIFPMSPSFQNPLYGLVKVLVMMTGELDMDMLKEPAMADAKGAPLRVTSYVVYALFVLFAAIVLMNLVVGIAVHDIQGLHKTAGLSKLVRQTELISFLELALFQGYLPARIVGLLKRSALISPAAYRVVLHVKPLNAREKRLPRHIMAAAYDIARENFNVKNKECQQGAGGTAYRYAAANNRDSKAVVQEIKDLKQAVMKQQLLLSEIVNALNNITAPQVPVDQNTSDML